MKSRFRSDFPVRVFALFFLVLMLALPALAQEVETAPDDLAARTSLAEAMHKIRSTRDQVNAAIEQVALAQPEAEREAFKAAMRDVLNYRAIEKISIDAMAETFTHEELEAMVAYYSKPEAQSASDKEGAYVAKVYPEIVRMLDVAVMRVRTGGN